MTHLLCTAAILVCVCGSKTRLDTPYKTYIPPRKQCRLAIAMPLMIEPMMPT
jgi:hypothetical protein